VSTVGAAAAFDKWLRDVITVGAAAAELIGHGGSEGVELVCGRLPVHSISIMRAVGFRSRRLKVVGPGS